MNRIYFSICLLLLCFSCTKNVTIKESSFCKSLVPVKYILEAEDGWWNWCMAPIYDEEGQLHVFMSAIPDNGSWTTDSRILHFTADTPEGPYTFVDTTFTSDTATYHNPQISKVGDTYVMVFLWKSNSTPSLQQSIGLATAKSLYGPWKESPNNPIIRPSFIAGDAHALHASNPSFLVDEDGRYRIYYKSISDHKPVRRTISLATADNFDGPWIDHPDNPLISYEYLGLDIEDPYAFYYKGSYYIIVEDRMDVKDALEGHPLEKDQIRAGGNRPGLIYTSENGIDWGIPEVGYQTNSYYFGEELSRTERPHILWKDGNPEYLFLANHGSREAGFILKIEDWK